MAEKNNKLSLVIITLNEEDNIARCIQSVPFADDIVVLDSGSTDKTLEIAKSLGARTFNQKFKGYASQKNKATQLAENNWVLCLDADEALSPELNQEIQNILFKDQPHFEAYSCPRLAHHLGRWIRHGGWYPDRQIRLYNRTKGCWEGDALHESFKGPKVGQLKGDIFHWSFKNLSHQVTVNNIYSGRGSLALEQKNKSFSVFMLCFKPISKFIECYIIKLGFLDGLAGYIIAVGAAYSMFLKYAKLWEKDVLNKKKD